MKKTRVLEQQQIVDSKTHFDDKNPFYDYDLIKTIITFLLYTNEHIRYIKELIDVYKSFLNMSSTCKTINNISELLMNDNIAQYVHDTTGNYSYTEYNFQYTIMQVLYTNKLHLNTFGNFQTDKYCIIRLPLIFVDKVVADFGIGNDNRYFTCGYNITYEHLRKSIALIVEEKKQSKYWYTHKGPIKSRTIDFNMGGIWKICTYFLRHTIDANDDDTYIVISKIDIHSDLKDKDIWITKDDYDD